MGLPVSGRLISISRSIVIPQYHRVSQMRRGNILKSARIVIAKLRFMELGVL